jgi:hypothetical protein
MQDLGIIAIGAGKCDFEMVLPTFPKYEPSLLTETLAAVTMGGVAGAVGSRAGNPTVRPLGKRLSAGESGPFPFVFTIK